MLACQNRTGGDVLQRETSSTQRQKFHTDDVNECLINPVVVGFQMQICSILRFSWSILVKCCVHLRTSTGKTQMLILEKTIFHSHWLFCYRFIAFTVDPCSLLSVIRKQYLKQYNYSVYQSALPTGFRTDFCSSVWNFWRWVAEDPPRERSPAARSEEKRFFSQTSVWHATRGARNPNLHVLVQLRMLVTYIASI